MSTVVATVPGLPGPNVQQHVTVVPNIDPDHMIADNPMIPKPFYVDLLAFILHGLNGHHALSAMVLKMNLSWLPDLVSKAVLVNLNSKKRLVSLHDAHTGEFFLFFYSKIELKDMKF